MGPICYKCISVRMLTMKVITTEEEPITFNTAHNHTLEKRNPVVHIPGRSCLVINSANRIVWSRPIALRVLWSATGTLNVLADGVIFLWRLLSPLNQIKVTGGIIIIATFKGQLLFFLKHNRTFFTLVYQTPMQQRYTYFFIVYILGYCSHWVHIYFSMSLVFIVICIYI